MGELFGLLASVCWGVSDFVTADVSRKVGVFVTLLYSEVFGAVLLTAVVIAHPKYLSALEAGSTLLSGWIVAVALLHIAALFLMIFAFKNGVLSVVSPVVSTFSAGTVVWTMILGERLSTVVLASLAVVICGIGAAAATPSMRREERSPLEAQAFVAAIVASVMFSMMFWILETRIVPYAGSVGSIWAIRLISAIIMLILLLVRKSGRVSAMPARSMYKGLACIAALEVGAYMSVALGSLRANVAVVTTLSSLFSPITVLLAWWIYGDRLRKHQWCGVVAILIGITFINLHS